MSSQKTCQLRCQVLTVRSQVCQCLSSSAEPAVWPVHGKIHEVNNRSMIMSQPAMHPLPILLVQCWGPLAVRTCSSLAKGLGSMQLWFISSLQSLNGRIRKLIRSETFEFILIAWTSTCLERISYNIMLQLLKQCSPSMQLRHEIVSASQIGFFPSSSRHAFNVLEVWLQNRAGNRTINYEMLEEPQLLLVAHTLTSTT